MLIASSYHRQFLSRRINLRQAPRDSIIRKIKKYFLAVIESIVFTAEGFKDNFYHTINLLKIKLIPEQYPGRIKQKSCPNLASGVQNYLRSKIIMLYY